jgi:hypothetical protein
MPPKGSSASDHEMLLMNVIPVATRLASDAALALGE